MDPTTTYLPAPINLANVRISLWPYNTHFQTLPEDIKQEAIRLWNIRLENASKNGQDLYEGNLLRFDEFKITKKLDEVTQEYVDEIIINVSLVNFSYALVFRELFNNLNLSEKSHPEDYFPQHLTAGALVYTSDNKIVIGKKKYTVDGEDIFKNDIPGGVISADEILSFEMGVDLEVAADKEVHEELNVHPDHITSYTPLGIVRNTGYNVMVLFKIQLDIPSEEVYERFLKRNDKELYDIEFIEENQLNSEIEKMWGENNQSLQDIARIY